MNETEVWQRVMAGRESAQEPTAADRPRQDAARQLWSFIQEEFADYSYYTELRRRFDGRAAAEGLRRLASDEKKHQVRLSTAYFIMTGESPRVGEFTGIAEKSRLQALRRCCIAEEKRCAEYLEAASMTDDARLAALYRELAADEGRHAEYLGGLIGQLIG